MDRRGFLSLASGACALSLPADKPDGLKLTACFRYKQSSSDAKVEEIYHFWSLSGLVLFEAAVASPFDSPLYRLPQGLTELTESQLRGLMQKSAIEPNVSLLRSLLSRNLAGIRAGRYDKQLTCFLTTLMAVLKDFDRKP